VDRYSHQTRLNGPFLFERLCEAWTAEVLETRPEPDVSRGRVLRLKSRDSLQCPSERLSRTLQQTLPCQQRSIKLAGGEDALGHPRMLSAEREAFETRYVECIPLQIPFDMRGERLERVDVDLDAFAVATEAPGPHGLPVCHDG
jgi:hypothetical protein